MKYEFRRLMVVTVRTNTLCHETCEGTTDYPENLCTTFGGRRELSDSEDVVAYKRLPECIQTATTPHKAVLPAIGTKVRFVHDKDVERSVVEVRELRDQFDEWKARVDPPLTGSFSAWEWVAQRYFV